MYKYSADTGIPPGTVTHYVLFFFDLATRRVKIAGITRHPCDSWMAQIARNLTDVDEPFLARDSLQLERPHLFGQPCGQRPVAGDVLERDTELRFGWNVPRPRPGIEVDNSSRRCTASSFRVVQARICVLQTYASIWSDTSDSERVRVTASVAVRAAASAFPSNSCASAHNMRRYHRQCPPARNRIAHPARYATVSGTTGSTPRSAG